MGTLTEYVNFRKWCLYKQNASNILEKKIKIILLFSKETFPNLIYVYKFITVYLQTF